MGSIESYFSNKNRNENGSALIYILFIIAIIAIVGSVMLTTVTQGQRNVVKSKDDLTHFYKAEGALEIIIEDLKANKGGAWLELEDYINSSIGGDPVELTIGGDSVFINVESHFSNPIVTLTDTRDESIYRVITFSYGGLTHIGPYPLPPGSGISSGGDGAFYHCKVDNTGMLNCEEKAIPNIYENDPDPIVVLTGNGDISVGPDKHGDDEGVFKNEFDYDAKFGIYIEPTVDTRTGHSYIKLHSEEGFIIVDGASFLTNQGGGDITMDAGSYISAIGTTINSKESLILGAKQYIDASHSTIISNDNTDLTISAPESINLTNAEITANRNQSDIVITSSGTGLEPGCINITGATFNKTPQFVPDGVRIIDNPNESCP